jgi:hypothetical protein
MPKKNATFSVAFFWPINLGYFSSEFQEKAFKIFK